jgi:tetratricopeptide (TPR) repeat protein
LKVLIVDLDPQANLTAMFLGEERLEALWPDGDHPESILGAVAPILRGLGDIKEPHVERITSNLGLLAGDLGLSRFEAKLSSAWPECLSRDEAAFRTESDTEVLGRAYLAAGRPDRGLAVVQPLSPLFKSDLELVLLAGSCLQRLGRDAEAVKVLSDAGSSIGLSTGILNALGESFLRLGDAKQALAAWSKSLELQPDQPDIKEKAAGLEKKSPHP